MSLKAVTTSNTCRLCSNVLFSLSSTRRKTVVMNTSIWDFRCAWRIRSRACEGIFVAGAGNSGSGYGGGMQRRRQRWRGGFRLELGYGRFFTLTWCMGDQQSTICGGKKTLKGHSYLGFYERFVTTTFWENILSTTRASSNDTATAVLLYSSIRKYCKNGVYLARMVRREKEEREEHSRRG